MKHFICTALALLLGFAILAQTVLQSNLGSIKISSSFGGSLYLDGEFYQSLLSGSTANWADIPVGEHSVELRNSRGKDVRKIKVSAGEICRIDFDSPESTVSEEPISPAISKAKELNFAPPEAKRLPLAKNLPSGGKGNLQLKSGVSGDLYLGGSFLGNISEGKTKKFSSLPAGDFSLELMHPNYGLRVDIKINNKETTSLSIASTEPKAYLRNMLYCRGGGFVMGSGLEERSDDEKPRHDVEIPPFLIGFTEVTQELWNSVYEHNPSAREGAKLPVTNVSWYEAVEFCNALSRKDGLEPCYRIDKTASDQNNSANLDTLRYAVSCDWNANGYRLPSEAEWEFAARNGANSEPDAPGAENTWFGDNSQNRVQEVATKAAGKQGLYDMSGNVYEWCWDYWGSYPKEAVNHPKGARNGAYRVARGGSWMSEADPCFATARSGFAPNTCSKELGFRLVRNIRAEL